MELEFLLPFAGFIVIGAGLFLYFTYMMVTAFFKRPEQPKKKEEKAEVIKLNERRR